MFTFPGAVQIMNDSVRIETLDDSATEDWDSYVRRDPDATFFHLSGWRTIIERGMGHRAHYLYAVNAEERVVGVFPLGQIKSMVFGNALISVPFCVRGGVCAETPAAHDALVAAGMELARDLGVDYLEVRGGKALGEDWKTKHLYVNFSRPIEEDEESNMLAIPRKQRAMVRKGIKSGLEARIDEGIDRLFEAYSQSVHNLGTPVFPKRYFRMLKECFGDDCEILTVLHSGEVVASVMSFYFRDQVLPYYGGGTLKARALKGNDFMYWELMRHSASKGSRIFDFGRSKQGTGSYSFKKNWGFEPEPLDYQYYLVKAKSMPDVSPNNPKYRMFVNAWKKLPLPVTRIVGPWIAKNLG